MSDELEQSRTEQATSYKLEQARKKGMVARSMEASTFAALVGLACYLWVFGGGLAQQMQQLAARALAEAPALAAGPLEMWTWTTTFVARALHLVLPLVLSVVALVLATVLLQVGFALSPQAFKPDFSRLNPAVGFKRIFSIQTVYESLRSIAKLALYGALAVWIVVAGARHAMGVAADPRAVAGLLGTSGLRLLFWLLGAMALFTAVDIVFVRRQFGNKMKMSRREVREEMRQREGDARIKQRRRQLAKELLKRARSMRQVRGADVLVTNPTHYAVALKYDPATMLAPQVVAKGSGDFALRLRRLAFMYGVPTVESKALARRLYFRVALDDAIPAACFHEAAAVYLRVRAARQQRDHVAAGTPAAAAG